MIGACRRGSGGAAEFPNLRIIASYPATGQYVDRATVCSGAHASLVSFDTDGDRNFEYRFLFDATGTQLWGCGDEACTGPIDGEIPLPKRVMIEGITVSPNEYGSRRHDVACRGVADAENHMGSVVQSPLAFPGLENEINAEVPMLRVGAFNGMFSANVPIGWGMAVGPMVAPADREAVLGDLRVSSGGIVVAAGGTVPGAIDTPLLDVWEFHPWKIAFERTAMLNTGHAFGSAQPFVTQDGDSEVLIVGGTGTGFEAVTRADVYRRGATLTREHPQLGPRYFAAVSPVEMASGPAVAVLNGCWGPSGQYDDYQHDFEVFYPIQAPAGCPTAGQPGFCKHNSGPASESIEGRCQAAAGQLDDGRVWLATGVRDDSQLSVDSFVFDGALDPVTNLEGTFTELINVQTPARLVATVPMGGDRFGLFGGYLSQPPGLPATATDRWVTLHAETGSLAEGRLLQPRGFATATRLLDGRVLVAGGSADSIDFVSSAEIIERATDEPGGQAENIAPAGHSTCTPGLDCEWMSADKVVHAATSIIGSATWLEGAVLITGGGATPELFVPAYWCDQAQPVNRLDGKPVPDAEFCDRLRDPQPVTDPRKPKKL